MESGTVGDSPLDGVRFYLEKARGLRFDEAKAILAKELSSSSTYREAWESAKKEWRSNSNKLMEEECYLAVIAYTLKNPNVSRNFNSFCRGARAQQSSWDEFPYKSLWCFLVRAFEKLPSCSAGDLYRGVGNFYQNPDDSVTFAQFVSASKLSRIASLFGYRNILLTLKGVPAVLVRDISDYSVFKHHAEVLIWPFCTFKVNDASSGDDHKCLEFVSAMPCVDRDSMKQMIMATLEDSLPATPLVPVPQHTAKRNAEVESVDAPSKELSTVDTLPRETAHPASKIMKLDDMPDAQGAADIMQSPLPQDGQILAEHTTPSVVVGMFENPAEKPCSTETCLLQSDPKAPQAAKTAVVVDGLKTPGTLCTSESPPTQAVEKMSELANSRAKVDCALKTAMTLDIKEHAQQQDSQITPDILTPVEDIDIVETPVTPFIEEASLQQPLQASPESMRPNVAVDDLPETHETCEIGELSQKDCNQIMPQILVSCECVDVSDAPETLFKRDRPLSQTSVQMSKIMKPKDTADDLSESPSPANVIEPLQLQCKQIISGALTPGTVADLPEMSGTGKITNSSVEESGKMILNVMNPTVTIDALPKSPVARYIEEPHLTRGNHIMSEITKPAVKRDLSEMHRKPYTPEPSLPRVDQMQPKDVKPSGTAGGVSEKPGTHYILGPQLPRSNHISEITSSDMIMNLSQTPGSACISEFLLPQAGQMMPKIKQPSGTSDGLTEVPGKRCKTEFHFLQDNYVVPKIMKSGVTIDISEERGTTFIPEQPQPQTGIQMTPRIIKPTGIVDSPYEDSRESFTTKPLQLKNVENFPDTLKKDMAIVASESARTAYSSELLQPQNSDAIFETTDISVITDSPPETPMTLKITETPLPQAHRNLPKTLKPDAVSDMSETPP